MMKLVFAFRNFVSKKELPQNRHVNQQGMQSAAGMTKEKKLFIIARSVTLLCVCVKGCIETYHTRKNYKANVQFTHIEQKNTDVTSDQNAGNLPLVSANLNTLKHCSCIVVWTGV